MADIVEFSKNQVWKSEYQDGGLDEGTPTSVTPPVAIGGIGDWTAWVPTVAEHLQPGTPAVELFPSAGRFQPGGYGEGQDPHKGVA